MNKLYTVVGLLFISLMSAYGQITSPQVLYQPADPSGNCGYGYIQVNLTTGGTSGCVNGTWASLIGAAGPTGPTGPTGPSGVPVATAQAVTSGVTTSVVIPFNGTLTNISQALPSCIVTSTGAGTLAWTSWTNTTTQMTIDFSGTTTAGFTGSCTAVLSVGPTGPTGPTGPGGISGLSTGSIPKAASATTLNDSVLSQSSADLLLTQNSVVALTSVNSGAVVNTLYLKAGAVGIGVIPTAAAGTLKVGTALGLGTIYLSAISALGANDLYLDTPANRDIYFSSAATATTNAFIKGTTGNFLIPGTTDGGYKLDAQRSGSSGTARFFDQTATTGSTLVTITPGAAQTSASVTLANAGSMTNTGTLAVSGSKTTSPSFQSTGTTFTLGGGCTTGTLVGGSTAGTFISSTTGVCGIVVTMGSSATAATGWICDANNRTTFASFANVWEQTADSTTTATLTSTTVSGDKISIKCMGY